MFPEFIKCTCFSLLRPGYFPVLMGLTLVKTKAEKPFEQETEITAREDLKREKE